MFVVTQPQGAAATCLWQLCANAVPRRLPLYRGLQQESITAVACGVRHSLALCASGRVLSWGGNTTQTLAQPTARCLLGYGDVEYQSLPRPVALRGAAIAIAAGALHSAVVLSSGLLVTWGYQGDTGVQGWSRYHAPLGYADVTAQGEPRACPLPAPSPMVLSDCTGRDRPAVVSAMAGRQLMWRAVSVACGQAHTVVLTASGTVLAFGCGVQGQLGRRSAMGVACGPPAASSRGLMPVAVPRCRQVFASGNTTFALTRDGGKLYQFGHSTRHPSIPVSCRQPVAATWRPQLVAAGLSRVAVGQTMVMATLDAPGAVPAPPPEAPTTSAVAAGGVKASASMPAPSGRSTALVLLMRRTYAKLRSVGQCGACRAAITGKVYWCQACAAVGSCSSLSLCENCHTSGAGAALHNHGVDTSDCLCRSGVVRESVPPHEDPIWFPPATAGVAPAGSRAVGMFESPIGRWCVRCGGLVAATDDLFRRFPSEFDAAPSHPCWHHTGQLLRAQLACVGGTLGGSQV